MVMVMITTIVVMVMMMMVEVIMVVMIMMTMMRPALTKLMAKVILAMSCGEAWQPFPSFPPLSSLSLDSCSNSRTLPNSSD